MKLIIKGHETEIAAFIRSLMRRGGVTYDSSLVTIIPDKKDDEETKQ